MFSRRKRNIFTTARRRRSLPTWIVGAATIAIGITVTVPSVAGEFCTVRAAPCPSIAIVETSPVVWVDTKTFSAKAEKQAAKRHSDAGRRNVAEMTLIGLLMSGGEGLNIDLGMR